MRIRLLLLLLLLTLASCAGGTAAPTPVQPAQPIIITLWHSWSGPAAQVLAEQVLAFQAAHPGVQVQLEEHPAAFLRSDYQDAVLAGAPPTLVLLSSNRSLGALADAALIQPVDDLVAADQRGSLWPAALEGAIYKEQLYGMPVSVMAPVLFYNRVNFPSGPPADTDQLLAVAGIERGSTPQRWGLAYNLTLDFTLPYLPAFGGSVFDAQGRVSLAGAGKQGAVDWLLWLRQLRNRTRAGDLLAVEDHQTIAQAVQSGQARLMVVDWSSRVGLYRTLWGDVGVAPLPPLARPEQPLSPAIPAVQSEVLALTPSSSGQQRRLAGELMLWLGAPQAQQRLLETSVGCSSCAFRMPARSDLDFTGQPLAAEMAAVVRAGGPAPPASELDVSWPYLQEMVRAVLDDRLEPDAAVSQTAAQLCLLLQQECQ